MCDRSFSFYAETISAEESIATSDRDIGYIRVRV
jgi:hypothetical protein